jgi:hypothetical protein
MLSRLMICIGLLVLSPSLGAQEVVPRLHDTEVTRFGAYTAWLTLPTERYRHGVLGDAIEAGGFEVDVFGKVRLALRLPAETVFEDRRVRLHDMDGDGVPEAIVIRSHRETGSSIVVYRLSHDPPAQRAASDPIGRPNRWLNIAGIGDFAGDGRMLIAAVITPHLAGSLRFYALSGAELIEAGRIDGFTNHIIGERDLDLARIADVDGDGVIDILMPSLDRRSLAAITFKGSRTRLLLSLPMEKRIHRLALPGRDGVSVMFDDGSSQQVAFPRRR